jgi:shikimate dehydrogenase
MPLKEAAYRHVRDLTPEARAAGAVNCVRFAAGKAQGHNTDGPGAAQVVDRLLPSKGASVLVLGTGGVARSIAGHLPDHRVRLTGRRPARLATLRAFLEVETLPWKDAAQSLNDFDLLINATAAQEPVPLNGFRGALFDLHYDPQPTVWERLAGERTLAFAGGRDLLLEQGLLAFEFWTGKPAPADVMRRALGAAT